MAEKASPFDSCPDCGSDYDQPCPGTVRHVWACDWKKPVKCSPTCRGRMSGAWKNCPHGWNGRLLEIENLLAKLRADVVQHLMERDD